MPLEKRALQERLQRIVEEALYEAFAQNGVIKKAVKAAVKQAVVRRVAQAAEQEAVALIDEALGVKEAGVSLVSPPLLCEADSERIADSGSGSLTSVKNSAWLSLQALPFRLS